MAGCCCSRCCYPTPHSLVRAVLLLLACWPDGSSRRMGDCCALGERDWLGGRVLDRPGASDQEGDLERHRLPALWRW